MDFPIKYPQLLAASVFVLATFGARAAVDRAPEENALILSDFRAPEFPPPFAPPPMSAPETPGAPGEQRPAEALAEPGNAYGFNGITWINSNSLTMAELRGQVVLIDFWEYTCINCIRTFADNKKWYERYHKYGFTIVGVHDPEFDIAYPADHVREAVKRFGLPYPIVVDDGFKIWRSYNNSTWPNRFLVDAKGVVRYHRPGEGADDAFERAIQRLLLAAHPGLKFPASYAIVPEKDAFTPECGIPTGEMYVGDWDGRGVLANPEGYQARKTLNYALVKEIRDGTAAVAGLWETDKNGMIYRGKNKGDAPSDAQLEMRYHARELYAVLNVSHGRPSRLYIQQDGKSLDASNQGADALFDSEGRSYIEVREARLYYLVQNRSFGSHSVTLQPTKPGLTINSFTFGNGCQTDFPHL